MRRTERRTHPRRTVVCPVRIVAGKSSLQGTTRDLSRRGTFLLTTSTQDISPDSVVTVHIGLPEKDSGGFLLRTISGEARVVRLDTPLPGDPTGVALHFAKDLEPFPAD